MIASHTASLYLAAALWAASALPTANAYCYIDRFGNERCTMSTGVRIAIGVVVAIGGILALIALSVVRRRRMQRANLAYIPPNNAPPAYPPQGPPYGNGGFPPNTNTGYYSYTSQAPGQGQWQQYPQSGQGEYPQYPPQTHTGYDPQSGFAPPPQPPQYSPPAGPPPQFGGKEGA
ncbi:hypothetical protein B0H21DRAFT_387560 [Amylocystis lapponica]|nr:hypothetical protein B0H21DRAFT_387560 [Amylocystis lapponica]